MIERPGSEGGDVFVYSPLRLRLASASIGLMLCVTATAITALAIGGLWGWTIGVVGVVVTVWATNRGLRLALRVSPEELLVRNYWREHQLRWLDVDKVGLGMETMGVMPRAAAAFGLHDGRTIRAQATPERAEVQETYFAALSRLAPDHVQFFTPVGSSGSEPTQ